MPRHGQKEVDCCITIYHMRPKLIDNLAQAKGCMTRMKRRLFKSRRMKEFNLQFQDNVYGGGGVVAHKRKEENLHRPRELHQHDGGIQDGTVSHKPPKDLHEQQH